MSEIMLQKSISTSSLVKQATAALEAQRSIRYPGEGYPDSYFCEYVTPIVPSQFDSSTTTGSSSLATPSSNLNSPTTEKRHIRWDNKVEQCIAVDVKDGDEEDDEVDTYNAVDSSSSEDEGLVMMKPSKRRANLSRTSSRGSFGSESKTIAMLPSTTLKDRPETPNPGHTLGPSSGFWSSKRLSPSPSQETIRPTRPSHRFMLDEDDTDDDLDWDPSKYFNGSAGSKAHSGEPMFCNPVDEEGDTEDHRAGLRRTPSGMFMPYDSDDDAVTTPGIIGRVVDTVNTARDIAHVIWNVGWRRP
jgi:hypothetical protein